MTSRLAGTVGLRYTRERKGMDNAGGRYALDSPTAPIAGTTYGYTDAIEHTAWTPKFSLTMKLPQNALLYVSATRGFKSGGFNLSSTQPGRGYAPEWAWSYEGGVKTTVMNGRVRFDVAAFHMDYTNLQVQTPVAVGVFDIGNAAAATINGVEIETKARIARGVEAGGHAVVAGCDLRSIHRRRPRRRDRRCRRQAVEQRAGMVGAAVGRMDTQHRPVAGG